MQNNQDLADVLNDLIRINNDRINGYENAIKEVKDADEDLKGIFRRMINESQQHKTELAQEVRKTGGDPVEDGTTASGKIYRAWMGVKATFTGKDRHSVLASCEFGEDAAQKAYQQALEDEATAGANVRLLITKQKNTLKESHDLIKKYRNMRAAI
ncbi:PA2169 family four-helix-bundle protein [Pseudoflavitalea sp. G-6-1-2]|uniref:ferritin-like domain-containing protein n=1 Tax=Pseudoflavitalea sp. G-6-1-2 TaxID=2728841 RepID=UPI00146CFBF2|nr:PA2169 family four-helix-bundle protein [Pseudoflavitalea sp. G-6-1-2]NML22470.1 PA2169 family four-helix-bundle protein [Pseudoflavitalea sp. G-6-1-2]